MDCEHEEEEPEAYPICFLAGTPVDTDQGRVAIEKITNKHTINGKKIVALTKVINPDNFLVLMKQNSLGNNVPSQDTYISKEHGVFVNGKLVDANSLVNDSTILRLPYKRTMLYNVLMEKHDVMVVNNMPVETLHPKNKIAQKYLRSKNKMIKSRK